MPSFKITREERRLVTYRVEAQDKGEAIFIFGLEDREPISEVKLENYSDQELLLVREE